MTVRETVRHPTVRYPSDGAASNSAAGDRGQATVVVAVLRPYNLRTNWYDWGVTVSEEDGYVFGAGVSETIRLTDSDFRSLLADPRGSLVVTNAAAMDLVE